MPRSSGGMSGWVMVKPFDVGLVDDRVGVAVSGRGRSLHGWAGSTTRLRGTCPAESSALGRSGFTHGVAEDLGPETDGARGGPGVGVEQELGRVAADPVGRVVGPGSPVAVGLPRSDTGHEGVPHAGVALEQRYLRLGARGVEEAEQ